MPAKVVNIELGLSVKCLRLSEIGKSVHIDVPTQGVFIVFLVNIEMLERIESDI